MAISSSEEISIIKNILDLVDQETTDMEEDILHNPVSNYSDPARYHKEIDILFRKFPIIVGHSGALAQPGQFITHNDTGVPLLVTRNDEGKIKAFMNVCRHRGMSVAVEDSGTTKRFSCPYHSWTYDLDGKLIGIPQQVGFQSIDKCSHGLIELPGAEKHGLLWVRPSAGGENMDFDSWLAPMDEQISSLDLAGHHVFRTWSIETNMNWKLAIEGFQESYHFCSAHKYTACSGYLNNQSIFLDLYPHVRHAVPLPNISELKEESPETWDYRAYFMTQNYLFPCNFMQVMTDHVYVHSIFPTGPDSCVFKCMMLVPEPPKTEKARRHWEKNYEIVRTVFGEDFEIGERIQSGLNSQANREFVFGRYERGLHLGKKAIDDALEGRLAV